MLLKSARIDEAVGAMNANGLHNKRVRGTLAMSVQHIITTLEFKLYPTKAQEITLTTWLRTACWTYNRCLEQRVKAYRRRSESISFNDQSALLTGWRNRIERLQDCPTLFLRDSLRRVDRGFAAFFRRLGAGQKPGFPRFRSHRRYNSLECLQSGNYISTRTIRIPKLAKVRARGRFGIAGQQKLLRIIRRASGWYAQVVIDTGAVVPEPVVAPVAPIGIDVGLNTFAALSNGEQVNNPRFLRKAEAKLKRAQRKVSRCKRGSHNRRKAVKKLARQHERVGAQRKDFAHQTARRLVNRFDLIAFEALNIIGLSRTRLAKSVHDAAWGIFLAILTCKAAYAGCRTVAVDPRGTSQTCPNCGALAKKKLSEREHRCPCGLTADRDAVAAQVILARALGVAGAGGGHGLCAAIGASHPDETRNLDDVTHY